MNASSNALARSGQLRWIARSLLIVSACSFAGYFVSKSIHPVYQASAAIILMRPVHELPDFKPEPNFNRWVWARDGMATQEGLLTDELLNRIVAEYPELENAPALRSRIAIKFAGAESQSFAVSVDHTSPQLALNICTRILVAMKEHHAANWIAPIENAITAVDQQIAHLNNSKSPQADKSALLRLRSQLQTQLLLQRSDESRQFRVVSGPVILANGPIWPKAKLFVALGLMIGLTIVVAGELLRHNSRILGK